MNGHLHTVPTALNEADEQLLGLRGGAQVHLGGEHPQNRPGPGVPPLGVGDHLALVDHRRLIAALEIQLFCRGGQVGVPLTEVLLLASGQRAVHPRVQQGLLGLQGQKAQGGQIDSGFRPDQPLEPSVGLAGVGAPQVENEPAVHGPCLGVFVLGVEGDEQGQAGADGLGDVPHRPHRTQPFPEQVGGREAWGAQQGVCVRLGLGGGEVG